MNEAIGSITLIEAYKPFCDLCEKHLGYLRETIVQADEDLKKHFDEYHKIKPYTRMIAPVVRP